MTLAPTVSTPVTDMLGIQHPVLCAPMGDAAGGRLAGAVSRAGGLGMIGGGYGDPRWLIRELDAAGDASVGVGFITFALAGRRDALHVALDHGVVAVQLSFGDPSRYSDIVHGSGALLICQVQRSDEIDAAVAAGADIIVAQGRDSGGHGRPDRGTMGLVPSVVDRVAPVPVVAAGGIADGRGLAAALMLGAAGVSMGTRFLAARESISNPEEARRLVGYRAEDTMRTTVFDEVRGPAWPDGHDARAVANKLTAAWHGGSSSDANVRSELATRIRASAPDDYSVRPLWAGEGLDLIGSIEPAAAIVETVVEGAARRIRSARALFDESPPSMGCPASDDHPMTTRTRS